MDENGSDEFVVDNEGWKEYDCANKATFRTETTIGTFFMGQNVFSVISRMTSAGIRGRNGAVFRVGRKFNFVVKVLTSSTWRPNNFGHSFRILLVVLFWGLLRQSLAQTTGEVRLAWVKSLDLGAQIAVDVHGDICLVGWKDPPGGGGIRGTDTAIRKLKGNGDEIWSTLYHDPDGYSARAGLVGLDSAGNIYAAGPVYTACPIFQCFAELVLKYDAHGNLTWSYRIQPLSKTWANAYVVTPLGNVFVAGGAEALEPPPTITYVYYSPVGLQTQGAMYVFAAATDEDSNFYLSGLNLNKYGPGGSLIWSTNQIGSGRNVAVGKGGSVYVSTYISTNNQWLVVKYSELGEFIWQKSGLPDSFMRVDSQENVIITAATNIPASSNWNLVITKYGSDGSPLWTRSRYYDNSRFYVSDSRLDANNAIYLAGTVETNSPTSRYISLLKYSPNGDLQWEVKYAPPGYLYNNAGRMEIDSEGSIYLSGSRSVSGATNEYMILKYEQASSAARLSVRRGLTPANPLVLSLFAKAGQTYRIESSPDLLVWTPFTNISNAFGTAETVLPPSNLSERKYYRAVFVNP